MNSLIGRLISPVCWEGSWPLNYGYVDKLANNIPLNLEDGKFLFNYSDLDLIGHLASIVKSARFGNKYSSMLMSTLTKQISAPWHANSALSEEVDVPRCLSIGNRRIH